MKVYCNQCKFYKRSRLSSSYLSCVAPENIVDTWAAPKNKLFLRPCDKNSDNNCSSFKEKEQSFLKRRFK